MVTPYHRNIARGLVKQPKIYFYDTGFVKEDEGARFENAVACALLKRLNFIEDTAGEKCALHYVRDKEKREVDFLTVRDGRAELERQILNSGVKDYVMRTGSLPIKVIQKYYSITDVFIMPSYCEGFPRVIIEAMASGLPFLSTDAGGMLDLAAEEQKRFVVPKSDVNAFSSRLIELMENADLMIRLGNENRKHVKKYSVENVAKMYGEKLFPVSILPLEGNRMNSQPDMQSCHCYERSSLPRPEGLL